MAYSIAPFVGVDLNYNSTALPYNDSGAGRTAPTPKLGTRVTGDDGHSYVFVKASAGIAASTAIVITEPAMTAAGGDGAYSTQGASVANGAYFWARSNAL